jgi:hypothetical protein
MRRGRSFVLLITEFRTEEHMKVRVALLVVSIASLLAALVCATGAVIQRGGPTGAPIIIQRGGPESGGSQA